MPSAVANSTSTASDNHIVNNLPNKESQITNSDSSALNHQEVLSSSATSKISASSESNPSQIIESITLVETAVIATDENHALSDSGSKQIRTTCPYCGVGCGVLATVDADNGMVSVTGDPKHPANYGKLCSKGSNLAHTLGTERRITKPYYQDKQRSMQVDYGWADACNPVNPVIQETKWDNVLDDIANRLQDTIDKHGRDSIMFYVSGQLLTEDYYVANKFIKGFIGNNNIDSNSRLCMSTAVAGHKRAFDADLVTGSYSDLENCDLLVLVGSNMAWCHPILFGRFLKAKEQNPSKKLIVIDPRRTDSCEFADLHLPLAPGTDTHLYNGLLKYLYDNGHQDQAYSRQCQDIDTALQAANPWEVSAVAKATGLNAEDILAFYKLVAANDKTVTAFSMGVNQSSSGTDKVNAITNTHLLTGRVGKAGANPFSLTGQPNAMGGREVGALSNLLAAHLDLNDDKHRATVEEFWKTEQPISSQVGVKACDTADAILDGRIKAIWIMATNPVVSLPEASKFRQALGECDLVIVSECSKDSDTIRCADIVLPAQGWAEKSGTVTNSERRISRQRQLLPAVGESRPDWWLLSQVAKRMGMQGFDYEQPSDIFKEHATLTRYKNAYNNKAKDNKNTDYSRLSRYLRIDADLNAEQYDKLTPFQWGSAQIDVLSSNYPHQLPKFIAINPPKVAGGINIHHSSQHNTVEPSSQVKNDDSSLGLRLITGRLRDQWHTMTRTALAPILNQQQPVPTVMLHPNDAKRLGLVEGSFVELMPQQSMSTASRSTNVEVNTPYIEQVVVPVKISADMREGDAFMPMHWSDAFASLSRVGTLIPTKVDPISSQPELKNSAVSARSVTVYSVGQVMVRQELQDALITVLRDLAFNNDNKNGLNTNAVNETKIYKPNDASRPTMPKLLYTISRQDSSLVVNLTATSSVIEKEWNNVEFWQTLVQKTIQKFSLQKIAEQKISNSIKVIDDLITKHSNTLLADLTSSVVIDEKLGQLRFVVQGDGDKLQATDDELRVDNQTSVSMPKAANDLIMAVYVATNKEDLPSTRWLDECFTNISMVPSVKWLLAGRPASGYIDPGAMVCSCMSVGENIIIDAITNKNCNDATEVGSCTKAGTNCGSCVGQINDLIAEYA